MSWQDNIKKAFSITTGDGKVYTPTFFIPESNEGMEFNLATYDFPNIDGSLSVRKNRKGNRYDIGIEFNGEDCWDVALAFKTSAANPAAWTIAHPVYGTLLVQPIAINDVSTYNKAALVIPVIETIPEEGAQSSVNPADKIAADKAATDTAFEDTYVENVKPTVKDKQQLSSNASNIYKEGKKGAGTASESYLNSFNTANSYISKVTTEPRQAMQKMQNLINAPAQFKDSVQNRLNNLTNQFNKLRESITNGPSYALKKLFEHNGAGIISTMALTTVTNIGDDYNNRKKVLDIIQRIVDNHNNFITDLDSLQSSNGATLGSYIPDSHSVRKLTNLVNFTVSHLFAQANKAKQERSLIVGADTNWIILAHRIYGLLPDDSTIEQLMNENDAGLLERTQVRAGRQIIYYV